MKVISKEVVYSYTVENYSLCDAFSETESSVGLGLCYALATCNSCSLKEIELEGKDEELGVPEAWYYRYSDEKFFEQFSSFWIFLNVFDCDDFGCWTVTIEYQSVEVSFTGKKDSEKIAASYLTEQGVNLLPLIGEIESATYAYNKYDEAVKELLKKQYKMSDKRAVLAIRKLLRHSDIYDEFVRVSLAMMEREKSDEISVEGYTAAQLSQKYPLSLLGAYNYLIYLRENPENALEDLKRGLPRK